MGLRHRRRDRFRRRCRHNAGTHTCPTHTTRVGSGTTLAAISQLRREREFGLVLYQDDQQLLRTFVQSGSGRAFVPPQFMKDTNGRRMMLIGSLAHTHPHTPHASPADHRMLADFKRFGESAQLGYAQRYSIIAQADGNVVMFDTERTHAMPTGIAHRAWQEILFTGRTSAAADATPAPLRNAPPLRNAESDKVHNDSPYLPKPDIKLNWLG